MNKAQVSIAQLIGFFPFMWIILKFGGMFFKVKSSPEGPSQHVSQWFVLWWVLAIFSKLKIFWEEILGQNSSFLSKDLSKTRKFIFKITKNCHNFLVQYERALKSFLLSYFEYCQIWQNVLTTTYGWCLLAPPFAKLTFDTKWYGWFFWRW